MMQGTTFNIQVSSDLLGFGVNQEQIQQNVNEWLVLSLFTEGHISSGKAANLLKISRSDFLSLLRKRGIAYIDFSEEELAEEIATVNALNLKK